ncbi:MAG: hypothetical protein ACTSXV_01620, partial [Alphaproteobacteria bacterium]
MKKYTGAFFSAGAVAYLMVMIFGGQFVQEMNFVRLVITFSPIFLIGGAWALYRASESLKENKEGVARLFSILTSQDSSERKHATAFIDSILQKEISKLTEVNKEITINLENV